MNKQELLDKIKNNKLSVEELVESYLELVKDLQKVLGENLYLNKENELLRSGQIKSHNII